jgi:transcriptional regulator with XRE-family HTH domain
MKCFFERLRHVASIKKKYQADVSLDIGKDRATVSKWWNGGITPGPRNMRLLADYFGCNQRWLETGEGEPFPQAAENAEQRWQDIYDEVLAIKPPAETAHQPSPARPPSAYPENIQMAWPDEEEHQEFSIAKMLTMTAKVLESATVYRSALASNIRAFYQAVQEEDEMNALRQEVGELRKDIAELKALLLSRDEAVAEKKRAGNDH